MGQKKSSLSTFLALALFGLMLGCILWLVMLEGGLYAAVNQSRNQNDAQRSSLSYLQARVTSADEAGAVALQQGPEGDLLVLGEPTAGSSYETRIYLYQGALVEEYAAQGTPLAPQSAVTVAETQAFSARLEGQLLTLTTGEGQVRVFLHSGGEAP